MRTLGNVDLTDSWKIRFLPGTLSLLIGLGLGPILAMLIVGGNWPFAFALVALVPLVILFSVYPFVAVLIWLLVMPFFAITPTVASRYIYWMFHRAMIPIALGTAILSDMLRVRKRPPARLGRAELATVLFTGTVVVSILLLQQSPQSTLILAYDRILVPFCMYWLVRLTAPRQKDLQRLLPVALIILIAESVIGLLSWFAPQALPAAWLGLQGARTTGSLSNPAVYTTTLMFFSLLIFQAAMNRKPGAVRSIFLFAFGLGTICVFLSFSRGSWLGGLLVGAGLLFLYPKAMLRMTVILLVLMIFLGSGALSAQMTWASERLEDKGTTDARIVEMRAALRMIQAKPFFGWGYNNFDRYDRQFQVRTDNSAISYDETSHNTWLTIMTEMGLIGFFLFAFPFVWWLMLTIKVRPQMPKKGLWSWSLLAMFWLVIGDFFIVNNFMDMRYFPFGLTLLWTTLAFAANMVCSYLKADDIGAPAWARRAAGLASDNIT